MPELPDLQVFAGNLDKALKRKRVSKVRLLRKSKVRSSEAAFNKDLKGASIEKVYREGKELHIAFDNGNVLALHMMLHGRLEVFEKKNEKKFTVFEMHFEDGSGLALTDFQGNATPALNPAEKAAPDALSKAIRYKWLSEKIANRTTTIKNFLLDQQTIRGIGNAYADEILYDAGISPFSVAHKIPAEKLKQLVISIRKVLRQAEKKIREKDPGIIAGEVRDFLLVHNAKKLISPGGKKIRYKMAGGRKTYYTAEQKLYK